jgi:hypothetical protein
MTKTLKQRFEIIVQNYVEAFEKQTSTRSGDMCEYPIFEFSDMFFYFIDVMYVVDNKVSFKKLHEWYYHNENQENKKLNLDSFLRGAPRQSQEDIEKSAQKIKECEQTLINCINEYKRENQY